MGYEQRLRACSPRRGWLLSVVCACVALLHLSAVASGAAWVTQPASGPALVANGNLASVSCVSPEACVAVGSFVSPSGVEGALIEVRRGGEWSIRPGAALPDARGAQLNAVACAATRGCIAVGFSVLPSGAKVPLAERWNGASWSIQQTIDPDGAGGQLSALACPSARSCLAVGFGPKGALIERWNGSRWSLQKPRGVGAGTAAQLDGVSCALRASCVAVGSVRGGALAELWNGRSWSRFAGPRGGGLTAVSCTSPQACSAISDTAATYVVERWNGRRWTPQNVPVRAPSGYGCDQGTCSTILSAITCVAPSACYLVGGFEFALSGDSGLDTTTPIAATWRGSRWRRAPVRNIGVCPNETTDPCGTSLSGLSCTARLQCVAVGAYSNAADVAQPLIEHRGARAWSVQRAPSALGPASSQLNAVSCPSATACTAVGSYINMSGTLLLLAERWNGVMWTIQPTPARGEFNGVSCPSTTQCTAVGGGGLTTAYPGIAVLLAETWNGTTWTTTQSRGAGTFASVSCPSVAVCMAVGAAGVTESWDGATWTTRPSPSADNLSAVSCVSREACLAAGQDQTGYIVTEGWNGTSWTALPLPQSQLNPINPLFTAVSCTAANACTVAANSVFITGSVQTGLESSEQGLAFRWDGAAWSTRKIQLPAGEDVSTIGGIACPSASSCTVVGSYSYFEPNSPELTAPLLEHFDGATWSAQQLPPQTGGPVLNGVSCPSTTTCMAVGERTIIMPDGSPHDGLLENVPYVVRYP